MRELPTMRALTLEAYQRAAEARMDGGKNIMIHVEFQELLTPEAACEVQAFIDLDPNARGELEVTRQGIFARGIDGSAHSADDEQPIHDPSFTLRQLVDVCIRHGANKVTGIWLPTGFGCLFCRGDEGSPGSCQPSASHVPDRFWFLYPRG